MTLREFVTMATRGSDHTSVDELISYLGRDRPLRVKYGIDPTGSEIHLGHTVPLRRLAEFQKQGHHVVLIIGDYTAAIGDPTGRNQIRPRLSRSVIRQNASDYLRQLGAIIDLANAEIRYNSEWFDRWSMQDTIDMMSRFTIQNMLRRADFALRIEAEVPIYNHELLYPMLQAYDSVHVQADVEIGGLEQKFNVLLGRHLQEKYGQSPQSCILLPILRGLDGVQKMGKTLGNYIGVSESPLQMFGKVMSIPDYLMPEWFQSLTTLTFDPSADPMQQKIRLARCIVGQYHECDEAEHAMKAWVNQYSKRLDPAVIDSIPWDDAAISEGSDVPAYMVVYNCGFASSRSHARTLVKEGAFSFGDDRTKVVDPLGNVVVRTGLTVRVGKHKIGRILLKGKS